MGGQTTDLAGRHHVCTCATRHSAPKKSWFDKIFNFRGDVRLQSTPSPPFPRPPLALSRLL